MKKTIIVASIVCSFALPVSAQLSTDSLRQKNSHSAKTDAGNLLVTLAGAIKPESYKAEYAKQKSGFLNRSKSAKDGSSIGANISEFIAYIKPEKFRKETDVDGLITKAKSISTLHACADMLKNVEGALKPDAISNMWSLSKEGWQNEVKQMQKSTK